MTVDEDFLGLMYGHDDEDETPTTQTAAEPGVPAIPEKGIMSLPALSHLVRQQAQMLASLGKAFAESERKVARLESRLRTVERNLHSVGRSVNSLDSEMENKLDKRGWQ